MLLCAQRSQLAATFTLSTLTVVSIVLGIARPASSQSSSMRNISQSIFDCMQRHTSGIGGWIVYDGDNSGKIRVYAAGAGQVGELSYSLDTEQQMLNLNYVRGPVSFAQIQNGLNSTASKCRNGEYQ